MQHFTTGEFQGGTLECKCLCLRYLNLVNIIHSMINNGENVALSEMGHQYPEARCFDRTFAFDPERQAQALRFLISFYGIAKMVSGSDPVEGEKLIDSISTLTEYFIKRFPECMEEEVKVDSECGGGTYHREDRLAHYVMELLSKDK